MGTQCRQIGYNVYMKSLNYKDRLITAIERIIADIRKNPVRWGTILDDLRRVMKSVEEHVVWGFRNHDEQDADDN